jgi:hypothetical protein
VYSEKGLRYNAARFDKQKADSMREKVDRLEDFVNRVRESQAGSASSTKIAAPQSGSDISSEVATLIGNFRISDTGGTRYVGPGHWESIIEDVSDEARLCIILPADNDFRLQT